MRKRILAAVLTLAMVFSLSVSASAANSTIRTEDVKIWGMWNILGEEVFGDASQEELRPWYYTWSLMCRHFPAGCDVLACEVP